MNTVFKPFFTLLVLQLFAIKKLHAQEFKVPTEQYITKPASTNYNKNKGYKKLFGEHYRKVWATPIQIKIALLDTLKGGLTPYELGGSRQTKSLKLRDKNNREWVLRSVDKTFGGALPDIYKGSFVENLANDQVTISNPYGALTVASLATSVGILHTNPELFYIPKQVALKEFNDKAGDLVYFLEQRPDEDWSTEKNFGYSKKIVSTEKMLEKLTDDNDNSVDELMFLRSRLFDFYINDWGRHEDQWRWAKIEKDNKNIYLPIPRDRDNSFTKFDGIIIKRGTKFVKPGHLQSFENNLKNVNAFAFTARGLDRRLLSSLSLSNWIAIAKEMQTNLTDSAINIAVNKMPSEILPILKDEYIQTLKARRDHIVEWAQQYYSFINEGGVDVLGTEKKEKIIINVLNENELRVTVFKLKKDSSTEDTPIYQRDFTKTETKAIRIFTLGNDHVVVIDGKNKFPIKLLIIGTKDNENVENQLLTNEKKKVIFYDDKKHSINNNTNIKYKFTDTVKYSYLYKYFNYNHKGFKPILFYNTDDRIHVGIGWQIINHKWNKNPFWNMHNVKAKYSIDQKGFSVSYNNTFTKVIANWNYNTSIYYDEVRWLNFYGVGNETKLNTTNRDYFRFRYSIFYVEPSLERVINNKQRIKIAPYYQNTNPITDTARFVYKQLPTTIYNLQNSNYAGIKGEYVFQSLNDSVLPVKGFGILLQSLFNQTIGRNVKRNFARFSADAEFYIPLSKSFSIAVKAGAATLTGDAPEFYQYNTIGGTRSVRGFQRDRFHGTTTFYNQNELRFIKNVKGKLMNGKIGLFCLYDVGRIYEKNENSSTWHYGYGGGFLISPFNKITLFAAYAKSEEDKNLHLGFIKIF